MKNKILLMCLFASVTLSFLACAGKGGTDKMSPWDSMNNELMKSCEEITAMFTDTTEKYYEGLKRYEKNGKVGFVDSLGNVVIKPRFDAVGCFNEGLCCVTVDAKQKRYLSREGDSATCVIGGKMGFIDRTGRYVVKPQYDYCSFFSQGVAVVEKDGKWGYINKNGEEVIKLQFDRAMDFFDANGFAAVELNEKWGLINIQGEIVVPIEHKHTGSTSKEGFAYVFPFDENIICYKVYNDGRVIAETINFK